MSNKFLILEGNMGEEKAVGVIKEVDRLGRIVIPKDYRERLCINGVVELLVTKDGILIRNPKYELVEKKK